jgi:tetratricopeptide (TPR) repeat protein
MIMKKRYTYLAILFVFAIASGFIILKYQRDHNKKESELFEIIPRKGNSIQSSEWTLSKKVSTQLMQKIKNDPSDIKSPIALAAIYLQEARCSGNFGYYDKAALNCVNTVLKKDANNFEALTFKAMIYLSQHHFAEGLKLATQIQKTYSYNAFLYGILLDANVELGNYKAALDDAEKMVSIRPDIRSYSRISYLREIYGDIPGAIEAMKLAVEAGSPGSESTEWARVQLGKLYEQLGDMKYAEMHYTISLENRPGYPYALAGLARIAAYQKDYQRAIELYQRADSASNDYSFKEGLVEMYRLIGKEKLSLQVATAIVDEMEKAAAAMAKGDSSGHYADKEMAYAYLAVNNCDKAIEHALLEYDRRPNNIDANETVAWAYYKKADYPKAESYIRAALQTGCQNPTLLCHAGLIYAKMGDGPGATKYFQLALKNGPSISPLLKEEAKQALNRL